MNDFIKKRIAIIAIFFCYLSAFSFTQKDVHIYTFENGLVLYLLQDPTTATVRMEINIKAGTICQDQDNAGYFSLYASLAGLEITPDCVKTEKTVAPAQVESTLLLFSRYFKPLQVSNNALSQEIQKIAEQTRIFSSNTAWFINQAIDSRVFPENPWKQASGTRVENFGSKTTEEARSVLARIKDIYYKPGNTSLYISGNITESAAVSLTQKYFGSSSEQLSSSVTHQEDILSVYTQDKEKEQRKFVLTDDELSPDITQIVIQYKDFTQDEADLIAAVFNNPGSEFKRLLLKQKNLSIRAVDYIDASSAQQNDSSRLVVQSICEATKVGPAVQGELFLEMSKEKDRVQESEAKAAIRSMMSKFTEVSDNSSLLMKNLAVFNQTNKDSSETLFNKNERIASMDLQALNKKYEESEPYIFVLCNTKNYQRSAAEFKRYGYERVTAKNGAWYNQEKYKPFLHNEERKENIATGVLSNLPAKRFVEENRAQISSFKLKNNIPVTIKYTPASMTAAVSLAIDGGELLFAKEKPGLSSVLVNCLASIIQRNLDSAYENGNLEAQASVSAWTGAQYSLLTVTCAASDAKTCLDNIAGCIIFGDITPALADSISYDLRSQWRIKTGSPNFQLLCEAVRTIYGKPLSNLYNDTDDKPAQMDFSDVSAAYPLLLDNTRFSITITGGVQQSNELKEILDSTFGETGTAKATENIMTKVEKIQLPSRTKKIQLRHQFFTDISAEAAGPRPLVLVPTTDFSDPILLMLSGPDLSSTDSALFNALLYLLEDNLEKKLNNEKETSGQDVKITPPDSDLPYAQVVVTKVKRISQTESVYKKTVNEIIASLKAVMEKDTGGAIDTEKDEIIAELENLWVINELKNTSTNEGTAKLIQKGNELGNPYLYLDMYDAVNNAKAEDYYIIAKSYLEDQHILRIYSADTKK